MEMKNATATTLLCYRQFYDLTTNLLDGVPIAFETFNYIEKKIADSEFEKRIRKMFELVEAKFRESDRIEADSLKTRSTHK